MKDWPTTPPVWFKVSQSMYQAEEISSVMAMLTTVEMLVVRKTGVALTIQQLRAAGVYTVKYDDERDRHLHEVFAPCGIPYQPADLYT
jgi:hypothetical protein